MKTTNVAIVNGISLQVVSGEREQLVAVKPVCEILGVAYPPQFTKLKEHPIFGSTITQSVTVGADGKEREMVCIPMRFFPGWLFSINPDNVKEEIRDNLIKYQVKCNDILYNYFFGRAEFALYKQEAIAKAREEYDYMTEQVTLLTSELKLSEKKYRDSLAITFEDWENERKQLTLPGFE